MYVEGYWSDKSLNMESGVDAWETLKNDIRQILIVRKKTRKATRETPTSVSYTVYTNWNSVHWVFAAEPKLKLWEFPKQVKI